MQFKKTVIRTVAHVLPDERRSSADIENELAPVYVRLGLPAGRLELMTGIVERRLWPVGTAPSAASVLAGRKALQQAGLPAGQVDMLVHAAVSRDCLEPATASFVHQQLGLGDHVQVLDISNACLGFMNAMAIMAGLIEAGAIRNGLVVAGENGRPLLERTIEMLKDPAMTRKSIKPLFASLTIGCGAAAAVLSHVDECRDGIRLLHSTACADTSNVHLCTGDRAGGAGLEMSTDSENLLIHGVRLAGKTWQRFTRETGWGLDTPDCVVTHQVGAAHRRELYNTLGLDLGRDFSSFEMAGNIGSAALPLTLSQAIEAGKYRRGQRAALLGIGSGINCVMQAVEW